ncbi:MAG: heme ABC exporter ATP-binding protein CcmA [Alphaproteobacteria bacterium]
MTAPRYLGDRLRCERGGRVVFDGLGFALAPGGALVLRGPNGSGKSSLLRLMAGLLRPAAGSLSWTGAPAALDAGDRRSAVAYAGHLDAVKPVLTVTEDLRFWARLAPEPGLLALFGVTDAQRTAEDRVSDALTAFELEALAGLPCRYLSAGQRRRLALARLVTRPAALWLLDEPTASLDDASTARLAAAIAAHRAAGGMVALSTHLDLDLADAGMLVLDRPAGPRP